MIRFLATWFGWIPVLGPIFRSMYIATLVGKLTMMARNWTPSDPALREKTGRDLDEALAEIANEITDGFLEPLELGLLASVVKTVAVTKMVEEMRKRVLA